MIKKGNVLLQVSIPKEVLDAMNVYCSAISNKLGIHITKGQLIVHMFNKMLDNDLSQLKALDKDKKEDC